MKVSVIIPTWNRGYIIEKTIQGVLNQTMSDLEVLVCDDGSTDDTYEKVSAIKDTRIRWIAGKRGGCPAIPRNNGIREAAGEWLAFLDSDDEWFPEKLKKQFEIIERGEVKAASSNALRLIPGKGVVGDYLHLDKERICFDDLTKVNEIITSSVIIHSSLIDSASGFPEEDELRTIEDYAFWLRIIAQTDFAYSSEPLLIYRDDAVNSVRGTVKMNVLGQKKEIFSNFIGWCEKQKKYESFSKKVKKEYDEVIEESKGSWNYFLSEKIKCLLSRIFFSIRRMYVVIIKKR